MLGIGRTTFRHSKILPLCAITVVVCFVLVSHSKAGSYSDCKHYEGCLPNCQGLHFASSARQVWSRHVPSYFRTKSNSTHDLAKIGPVRARVGRRLWRSLHRRTSMPRTEARCSSPWSWERGDHRLNLDELGIRIDVNARRGASTHPELIGCGGATDPSSA